MELPGPDLQRREEGLKLGPLQTRRGGFLPVQSKRSSGIGHDSPDLVQQLGSRRRKSPVSYVSLRTWISEKNRGDLVESNSMLYMVIVGTETGFSGLVAGVPSGLSRLVVSRQPAKKVGAVAVSRSMPGH